MAKVIRTIGIDSNRDLMSINQRSWFIEHVPFLNYKGGEMKQFGEFTSRGKDSGS